MIGRVKHVALAVPDLAAARRVYGEWLGATVSKVENLPEHGVSVIFVDTGNTKIELLCPLGENSPIEEFLSRSPDGGIHHICYEVPDIIAARDKLISLGVRVLGDGEPKTGAHGKPVLFLHPKDFFGSLIELEEA